MKVLLGRMSLKDINLMIPVENAQIYQKYITGENFAARKQCLDFERMELECEKYNSKIKGGTK